MKTMKPIIDRALFQRSYFSMASGLSIEPLLRMSHISQDFIYTNLYLEKDYVKKWYDQQIQWAPDLELVSYEEVNDFDELRHFELPANYQHYLHKPSYITMDEFRGYQNSFSGAIYLPQYCLIYRVLRRSTKQILTLYFVVSESFATLNLLSCGGQYMPRVIETIQAGELLGDPSERGLLTRFLKHAKKTPLLVIRGFQPYYSPFSNYRSNILSAHLPLHQVAMDFSFWESGNWEPGCAHDPCRYVKAFTSPECVQLIQANQKPIHGHVSLKLTSMIDELPHIPQSHVLVMGEHLASNPVFKGRNVITWESMRVNKYSRNYYHVDKLVSTIQAQLKYKKITSSTPLHIIPSCLNEDQGKQFLVSMEKLANPSTTYVHRPFDMIDCRLEDFELFFNSFQLAS